MTSRLDELSLVEKIEFYGNKSTFHGVPNIVYGKKSWTVKIMWLLCIGIASIFCIKSLIENTQNYLQYNVDTVIKITQFSENDYADKAIFPTITLCNVDICG